LPAIAAEAAEPGAAHGASPAIADLRTGRGEGPTISRVSIGPDGTGVFEGVSAPRARIALTLEGRAIARTIADARGSWQLNLPQAFAVGEHRLEAVARTDDQREPSIGEMIRISIPDGFGALRDIGERTANRAEQNLLLRAGELADRASGRFDELLPDLAASGDRMERAAAPAESQRKLQAVPPATEQPRTVAPGVKIAQIEEKPAPPAVGNDGSMLDDVLQWLASTLANVQAWLESSQRDYQSVIVRRLSNPAAVVLTPSTVQLPSRIGPPDAGRLAEAERLRRAEADRAAQAEAEASRKSAESQRIATAEKAKAEAEAKHKAAQEARRQQAAAKADAEAKRKSAEAQKTTAAEPARALGETKREAAEVAQRRQEVNEQPLGASKDTRTASSDKQQRSRVSDAGVRAAGPTSRPSNRAASQRMGRRDRSDLVRPAPADKLGSEDLCNFFRYRYPMALLDPGGWLTVSAPQRR
jgi:hypothetical protein